MDRVDDAQMLALDYACHADGKPVHQYVMSAINVPDKSSEWDILGLDLDNDSRHSVDNNMGFVIQMIGANVPPDPPPPGVPRPADHAQVDTDAALASGNIIQLVQANSTGFVNESAVALQLFTGLDADADPGNNFAGAGTFMIDPAGSRDLRFYGDLRSGLFQTAQASSATIKISLGVGYVVQLPLVGARIRGELSATGLIGKLGGGIPKARLETEVVPAMFLLTTRQLTMAPGSSRSLIMRDLFDADGDGSITEPEFRMSNTIQTMLAPDVDLLLADGVTLGQDGVKESLSLGIGFTATQATWR